MHAADAVLFVVDSKVGIADGDEMAARMLRPVDVPVLVVANKVDHSSHDASIWEFLSLGLGDPRPVSALHGHGVGDLLDSLIARLRPAEPVRRDGSGPGSGRRGGAAQPEMQSPVARGDAARRSDRFNGERDFKGQPFGSAAVPAFSVVLVGRPNVGKSTLFNRLAGDDLAIVHDQPGTTRDSVDTLVATEVGIVRFVDTAGMRRQARIDSSVEYYSLLRALRAVEAVDIALLVVDSSVGVTRQDQRLAERVDAAGCPIVVMLNKWDLLDTEARLDIAGALKRKLGFLGRLPVLRVSALTGKGVARLWPSLQTAVSEYRTRIPTSRVNEAVRAAQSAQPAPSGVRILYAVQGATDPPTFTLFVNRSLPQTYLRYVERRLREAFGLQATAVKLRVRRYGA